MMIIEIFDVGHGGCAVATMPNGARVMLDCGFNSSRQWFPSVHFHGQWIDLFVALNLDEDHLDDFPYLWENVRIGTIYSNPTVDAPALSAIKPHGMQAGVAKMHDILPYLSGGHSGPLPIALGGPLAWCYYNRYPQFKDTNNLSLAVFFRFGLFTILFAGDLERAGWRALLAVPGFAADLRSVNVLVASHHGRDGGCCEEVFEHLLPDLVIFSDAAKQYETQETGGWYARRARGIPDMTQPPGLFGVRPVRRVLTTRRDGTIRIEVSGTQPYSVFPERSLQPPIALTAPPTGLGQRNALLDALLASGR